MPLPLKSHAADHSHFSSSFCVGSAFSLRYVQLPPPQECCCLRCSLCLPSSSPDEAVSRYLSTPDRQERAFVLSNRAFARIKLQNHKPFPQHLRAAYTTDFAVACNISGSSDPTCGSCNAQCQSPSYMLASFCFGSPLLQVCRPRVPLHRRRVRRHAAGSGGHLESFELRDFTAESVLVPTASALHMPSSPAHFSFDTF